jgi:hypothetical protein
LDLQGYFGPDTTYRRVFRMRLQVQESGEGFSLWVDGEEHVNQGSRAEIEEAWCALTRGGLVPWPTMLAAKDAGFRCVACGEDYDGLPHADFGSGDTWCRECC